MEIYESDREQVEALRKWWKENGGSIVLGAVLGLGAVFGWRAWQGYEQRQAVRASTAYQELLDLADKGDRPRATAQGEFLVEDQPDRLYGALGGLLLAKLATEQGDLAGAAQRLESVIKHADLPELKAVAQIQLARVRLAQGQSDEALTTAKADVPAPFAAALAEARGDILLARGETASAAEAYRQALAAMTPADPSRRIVEIKLDDLGLAARPGAGS